MAASDHLGGQFDPYVAGNRTMETGHMYSFARMPDNGSWVMAVNHPKSPRAPHLEDLGAGDEGVPERAEGFLRSNRGLGILRSQMQGTFKPGAGYPEHGH